MVTRLSLTFRVVLAGAFTFVGADLLGAQDADVSVGVRPDRVRVGDSFVVTVRVVGAALPDFVDLDPGAGADLVTTADRTSTGVGDRGARRYVLERDFEIVALVPGTLRLDPVFLRFGDSVVEAGVPEVRVFEAGLDWGVPSSTQGRAPSPGDPRAREPEPRLLPEGSPPAMEGRTYDATRPPPVFWGGVAPYGVGGGRPNDILAPNGGYPAPYGVAPGYGGSYLDPYGGYGAGVGSMGGYGGYGAPGGSSPLGGYGGFGGYGGAGRLPPGEGWAETATADPWWPELIPELGYYPSVAEDPQGLALLETGLTPDPVYVGQQVTLVATATFPPEARYRMSRDPEFFPAGATEAWVVDVPWAPPAPSARGGRLEEAHTFLRAYFPMRAGRLIIDPARLEYSVGDAGAGRPAAETLTSGPLSVAVLPVPAVEAPPGWTGAIGRYRVSARLSSARVGWGESAVLLIELAGVGHLPSQPAPDPGALWGGGLRPLGERAWVEVRDGVIGGVKRFTWLVVPVEAGTVRIEPIVYTYFDPYVGAFGQVSTDELVLEVDPYPPGPGQASLPAVPGSGGSGSSGPAPWPAAPDQVGEGPPPSSRSNDPTQSPGTSSPTEVPATGAKSVLRTPGAPELDARMLELRLEVNPGNPKTWLDLGAAYSVARPGEGWAEWAWLAGLRNQPRNPVLREAVWGEPGWRAQAGLPLVPLSSRESLFLGTFLLCMAAVLGLGVIGPLRGEVALRRRKLVGLSATMVLAGALALAPWMALRTTDTAVAVGGPAALHSFPSETSEVLGELTPGTPVRLRERFGAWMRIEAPGGVGWAEAARLAELPSVPAGM